MFRCFQGRTRGRDAQTALGLARGNEQAAVALETYETPLSKAKEEGVVALFGEKYGDVVRFVDVPGIS